MVPIIGDVINAARDILSEVVVDKDKKAQLEFDLIKLGDEAQARLDAQITAQIEVNKVEAASGSVFVAGWRPAIGWVGAAALGYAYIIQPFISVWHAVPPFDFNGLYNIVLAMLGVGAMRTYEKVKGVSTNDYRDTPARVVPKETPEEQTKTIQQKPKRKFSL